MAAATIPDHLCAAARLAVRNPAAINDIANTPAALWYSFTAAFIVLPIYIAVLTLSSEGDGSSVTFLTQLGPYAVDWLLFPVVMLEVVEAIDRRRHYCRYIAAANWCAVIELSVTILPFLLSGLGVLSIGLVQFLFVGIVIWVLFFQAFVARVGLQLDWSGAALIVGLRLILDTATLAFAGALD